MFEGNRLDCHGSETSYRDRQVSPFVRAESTCSVRVKESEKNRIVARQRFDLLLSRSSRCGESSARIRRSQQLRWLSQKLKWIFLRFFIAQAESYLLAFKR